MSLKNILLDISSKLGLDISDADEKAYFVSRINQAAEELYRSNDIPGCLREQLFQYDDSETYQIALPSYVDKIRAIRFYDVNGGKIALEDMRPRYHLHNWGANGRLRFRIVRLNSLLRRSINNAALFTFTLTHIENVAVVINLIGKTNLANIVQETITIPAGQLSVTTVNSYEEFKSIEKTALNTYNINITDADDEDMGSIDNNLLSPSYMIIQIRQDDFAPITFNSYPLNTIECLYKPKYVPFVNLYDEFQCPNCDNIIVWRFIADYAALKPEMNDLLIAATARADQLLTELNKNDSLGVTLRVEYAANPMYEAQKNHMYQTMDDWNYCYPPTPLYEYTV